MRVRWPRESCWIFFLRWLWYFDYCCSMPMPLLSNQWRGNRVCLFIWSLGMWISYSTPLTCLILLYEYESSTVSYAGAVLISSSVVQPDRSADQSKSHITVNITRQQPTSAIEQKRKENIFRDVFSLVAGTVRLVQIASNQMANKRSVGACLRWVDLARPNSTRTDWNTLGANVWCGHVQVQLLEKGFSCLFQQCSRDTLLSTTLSWTMHQFRNCRH